MKITRNYILIFFAFILLTANIFAQTERDKGLELYKQGDYKNAVKTLEKFTKNAPDDYLGFYYLGIALERLDELKDAEKALEKSIELKPDFADSQAMLALVYFKRNRIDDAVETGEKAVDSGFESATLRYILGVAYFRRGDNEKALENSDKAVKLNSNFPAAYLLKAYALMNFTYGTTEYEAAVAKYGKSGESLRKAVILSKNSSNDLFEKTDQDSLEFFANYYSEEENKPAEQDEQEITPLKLLSKPRPSYTDTARRNNVSGTITLLVAFEKTGKIKHILVVRGLGSGLDEIAIKSARSIKFTPQMKDGVFVTTVKMMQFSFSIY